MAIRIGVRLERPTLWWAAVLVAGLAAGMVVVAAGMAMVVGDTGCDADFRVPGCGALAQHFAPWEHAAQILISLLWILPLGLGALLGVGITAGEIERRTAQISWSLSGTRIRWFLVRSAPVALALVVALSIAAGFAELAERGRLVTDDPGFYDYQLRSPIVPARGLLSFAVGLTAGVVIGRTLPALLVAVGFGIALTAVINLLLDTWHVMAATLVPVDQLVDEPWRDYALPAGTRSAFHGPDSLSLLMIPPSEFWFWVVIEAAVFLVVALGAWALAAVVVARRSP